MTIFRKPWRITPKKLGIIQKERAQDKRDRKGLSVELEKHLKTLNFKPPEPDDALRRGLNAARRISTVPSIIDRQREAMQAAADANEVIEDPSRLRFNLGQPRLAPPLKTKILDGKQRRQLIPLAKVTNELRVALSQNDLPLDEFLALDEGEQAQLLFPNLHPTVRLAQLVARMKEAIDEQLEPPTGGERLRAGVGNVAGLLKQGAKAAINAPVIPILEGPEGTKIKGVQTGIIPSGIHFESIPDFLEEERRVTQKATRPVLGAVGQVVGETIFDPSGKRFAVPFTGLGKANRSPESTATREALAAGTAELFRDVGGEIALFSNLVPIPFLDPLIMKILSKTVGKIPAVFRAGKALLTPEGRAALRQGLANIMSDPSASAAEKVLANQSMRELVTAKPVAGGALENAQGFGEGNFLPIIKRLWPDMSEVDTKQLDGELSKLISDLVNDVSDEIETVDTLSASIRKRINPEKHPQLFAKRSSLPELMDDIQPVFDRELKQLRDEVAFENAADDTIFQDLLEVLPDFHPKFTSPESLDFVVKKQRHGSSAIAKVDGIELHLSSTSNPNDPEVGLDEIQIIIERVSGKASLKEIKVLRDIIEELVELNPELEFFATTSDTRLADFYRRIGLNQAGERFGEPMFTMPKEIRPTGTRDVPVSSGKQDFSQFSRGRFNEIIKKWFPLEDAATRKSLDGELEIFLDELAGLDETEFQTMSRALRSLDEVDAPELSKQVEKLRSQGFLGDFADELKPFLDKGKEEFRLGTGPSVNLRGKSTLKEKFPGREPPEELPGSDVFGEEDIGPRPRADEPVEDIPSPRIPDEPIGGVPPEARQPGRLTAVGPWPKTIPELPEGKLIKNADDTFTLEFRDFPDDTELTKIPFKTLREVTEFLENFPSKARSVAREQAEDIGEIAARGLGAERFITEENIDSLYEMTEEGFLSRGKEFSTEDRVRLSQRMRTALNNLSEGKPHGLSQEDLQLMEEVFSEAETFTSIDLIDFEVDPGFPPFLMGGSNVPPTVAGAEPPSLDLWRKLSWSMLHAPNAQDMLRRVSKKLSEIPLIKNLLNTTGGPAAIADLDPVLDASVIYEVMKDLMSGERSQALASLRSRFGMFTVEAGQTGRVKIGNRFIAMGDLAESVLKGETKYKLSEEEIQWIRDAKAFIDLKAAQVEAVTGEKLVIDEFYWPRFTVDDKSVVRVGGRPGSKPSPLKERIFEVQEESIQLGNRYADPQSTVELYSRALDQVILDRLFRDVLDETQIMRTIIPEELVDPKIHSAMAVATERLRIAKQRALRERNVVTGSRTEVVRSLDILRGRQSVAREKLAGIKGELKPRRKQVPLSTGTRLRAAEAEATRTAEELQAFRVVGQDVPKPEFPARGVSQKVKREVTLAQAAFNKAKNARANAMKRARTRAASGKRDEVSGAVLGPGFSGRVISKEDLAKIQKIIKPGLGGLRPFEMAAAIPRLLVTGSLDVGQMMIQLVLQLSSNPVRWSSSVGRGFQAMLRPRDFLRWMANSPDAADAASHLVDMGGSEFTEAVRSGPLSKLGKVTDIISIIPRGFDGMLTASRVYEYKALADVARAAGDPESELFRVGRYVNTKLGTTGVRGLGISATQRQVENAFGFYSSRYTRSLFGMVGYLFGKGVTAKDARVSLAKMAFGATITVYALARALGMSHKEALDRINPRSGSKFMSLPIGGNEYGFGSGFRSFVKFLGDLTVRENWEFDSWGDAAKDNPFVRYLRSRTTPLTGTLMDFITGEDFIGQQVDIDSFVDNPLYALDYLSEKTLPLNLRAYFEAHGSLQSKIASGLVETIGGRTFKRSRSDILAEAREKSLKELYPDFKGSFKDLKNKNRIRALKVDEDPRVVEALKAFEEQGRFKESQESKFFGAADEALQEAFTEQENDDRRYIDFFVKGEGLGMDPELWKKNFRERQVRLTGKREGLQEAFGIEFGDSTDDQGKVNRAIENYYAVNFDVFVNPVTGEINWDGFFSARDRALSGLSSSDRQTVEEFLHRNDTPLIGEFRRIRVEVSEYYEIDSEDRRARELWRIRNPRGDAVLWILGNVARVMTGGALREAEALSLEVFGTTVRPPLGAGGSVNPVFAGPSFQPFRPKIGVR